MRLPRFNIASVIFVVAIIVAVTLVTVLLRNPATHANLEDPGFYDRTELAYLGRDYVYLGYGEGALLEEGTDPRELGQSLYVRAGCIGCHGSYAEGAIVAGTLWDIDQEEVADFFRVVRDGPEGMPAYPESVLAESDLSLILEFLTTAPADAAALGIDTTTTTRPPPPPTTTTEAPPTPGTTSAPGATTTLPPVPALALEAPAVTEIVVDGDASDWDGIPGIDVTLEEIEGESVEPRDASVRVAYDDSFIYVLYTVEDDFNWSSLDPHFAGAPAVMWAVEASAGPHMGGEDPSGEPGLGLVDIWYWRLECPIGEEAGGSIHGPGGGNPGNDATCNLDDEWATDPETNEDDDGDGAENSLLGVFSHSNPVEDGAGTWFFEIRRPLQTGDAQDAQFVAGGTGLLAMAYWDPDAGDNGWGRRDHVQSSSQGWIEVSLVE